MSNESKSSGIVDFMDFIGNLAEIGKDSSNAPDGSMDDMFASLDSSPEAVGRRRAAKYLGGDPMSRSNDVSPYQSQPYQGGYQNYSGNSNQRYSETPLSDPYNYKYGYASDPVQYNRNQSSYFQNSQYQYQNQYAGSRRNTGNDFQCQSGTTSSSYGMGGRMNNAPMYDSTPQNPFSGRQYDARDYEFPENSTFGGRGGYGW
jgi:hypothetical protein